MKKRLITAALLLCIPLSLASCAAPASAPETPPPTSASAIKSTPPTIPEEERRYVKMPCLVKLEPYTGGSFTDGANTFAFEADGTVLWYKPGYADAAYVHTFEKKDISKPPDKEALVESDEYKAVCKKVREWSGSELPLYIAHRDGDTWYLYYDYPTGGGSGESYWIEDRTVFVRIGSDGEITDFGALKAAHIVWYEDFFYYVELVSNVSSTPGIGKVRRVDMNGANMVTIVDEPVFGTIQVINDRVCYTCLADGRAYSVDLDGKEKIPISEKIVPVNHRIGLEFYGDVIISKYWNHSGYSNSYFTFPTDDTAPAIMDINERDLVTFPSELCGDGMYEVINWGGEDSYYQDGNGRLGVYFLFLKSNYDGAYWVYEKWGFDDGARSMIDWARDGWAEKVN